MLDNKCYNCAKALLPDRSCISNGDCEWFEEDDGKMMTRFMRSLPEDLVNAVCAHREEIERLLPKIRR